ncbi:N-acetylmuramoyl-L-alanine amidase [Streptomyces sp. NPDC002262]|uniref:peptidoglycan recognition protein family protein n=1 Tax=Streptomyces sp. NPDC002262 TaxID=3154414 RepID=UPI003317C598
MSPRGARARRANGKKHVTWLAAGVVVLGGTAVTAVAASAGGEDARPGDGAPRAKAHALPLDGKDPKRRALPRTGTQAFSLVGVSWEDSGDSFGGTAQIRTRGAATGEWSAWRDLDFEVRAPESAEGGEPGVRGASEPLWVGPSDGVEARVVADDGETSIPDALRLDMIDPGETVRGNGNGGVKGSGKAGGKGGTEPTASPDTTRTTPAGPAPEPSTTPPEAATGEASTDPAPSTAPPQEPTGPAPTTEPSRSPETGTTTPEPGTTTPTTPTAPTAPTIVSRADWGADESLVQDPPSYLNKVDAVFVHHTAGTNDYACADSPAVIRAILAYHVRTNGWNDVGYNFFVDKCGTVFEGRAGGVDRPVLGAHTYGFNSYSSGVSLLGDYENGGVPTAAAQRAIADLAAWKLGLHGVDPEAKVTLTAAADTGVWTKGQAATLHTVSGHRDGYATLCPGATLYSALPGIRAAAGGSPYATGN